MHVREPGSRHTPERTQRLEVLHSGSLGGSSVALLSDGSGPSKPMSQRSSPCAPTVVTQLGLVPWPILIILGH